MQKYVPPCPDGSVTIPSGWQAPLGKDTVTFIWSCAPARTPCAHFIRNPEANLWVERHFNVFLKGDQITMINQEDTSDIITGRYDARTHDSRSLGKSFAAGAGRCRAIAWPSGVRRRATGRYRYG
jgi:hypothetical protein